MRKLVCATAALALAAFGARAAEPPKVITQPDWLQRPQVSDLERAYPKVAQLLDIEGFAAISCTVDASGKLRDCKAREDTPAGLGFGAAAVALGPTFRMTPMRVDGKPVDGGEITIPITFRLPPGKELKQPDGIEPKLLALGRRYADATGGPQATEAEILRCIKTLETQEDSLIRRDAIAALRTAVAANRAQIRDAYAIAAAQTFTEAELRTLVAMLEGPGARYLRVDAERDSMTPKLAVEFYRRSVEGARTRFCRKHRCDPAPAFETPVDATLYDPKWAKAPSESTINTARPPPTRFLGLPGAVRLKCTANATGGIEKCGVVAEAPAGLGFGKAALALTSQYQLQSGSVPTRMAGETVAFTIAFRTPMAPPAFEPPAARSNAVLELARQIDSEAFRAREAYATKAEETAQRLFVEADPTVRDDAASAWREASAEALDWMIDALARAIAAHYSEAELTAIAAFKASPNSAALGAKLKTMAALTKDLGQGVNGQISRAARETFCKAHACEISRKLATQAP